MPEHNAEFGAHYWSAEDSAIYEPDESQTYRYKAFIGKHEIVVEAGDSVWYLTLDEDGKRGSAHVVAGPETVLSPRFAIVIRGYSACAASTRIGERGTVLPYVNGCSTREVFAPPRLGDPTLQYLLIPAHSKEQAHHIHSTARVVYVLRGKGISVVGMEGKSTNTDLLPGMVCILDPMCPHHFETPHGESIEVIPFHVWSSVPGENNHPMFRGTFLTNQGE